jgi:hypothetical protein
MYAPTISIYVQILQLLRLYLYYVVVQIHGVGHVVFLGWVACCDFEGVLSHISGGASPRMSVLAAAPRLNQALGFEGSGFDSGT